MVTQLMIILFDVCQFITQIKYTSWKLKPVIIKHKVLKCKDLHIAFYLRLGSKFWAEAIAIEYQMSPW